ncbi:MAG: helix-turn-helix domain-containing protein [Candidatus Limnocylindria bacterium]
MTAKLDYKWKLRELMATRGLFSTTDLRPKLAERGLHLSSSQVYRLVAERPERLSLKVLMALLDILDCSMDELIEPIPVATSSPRVKAVGAAESGVGGLRPKRARIAGVDG